MPWKVSEAAGMANQTASLLSYSVSVSRVLSTSQHTILKDSSSHRLAHVCSSQALGLQVQRPA